METGDSKEKKPGFRLGYVRALDGLRGVAILLVLLTHLDAVPNMYGFIGVDIFFVLSGFLITCLLVEEWDRTGRISVRAFYVRRALRLLPALVVMLLGFLVYSHFCHPPAEHARDAKEALIALFYSTNWSVAFKLFWSSFLSHTWSLSIEEQFYLLWPLTLIFLLGRTSRKSLFSFLLLAAILALLDRFLLYSGTATDFWRLSRGLDTRADSLLIGCAIGAAISSDLLPRARWLRPALRYGSAISFAGFGVIGQVFNPGDASMYYAGWFLMSLFSGVIILELSAASGGIFHWVMNSASLVCLGRVSYGLYLWHWPIILALNESGFKSPGKYWWLRLALTAIATIGSFYLVERPFLRLKRHFQKAD